MPEFQTVELKGSGQGLFSAEDIERMMRAEFDRAQRHGFPLVVMLVAVDRLDQLQDLYGWESRDEILRAVVAMLRASLRDSDLLGLTQDDRILMVFPHTTPESAGLLARRILAGARKMRFDRDGRTLRASLSIGVANNRQEGELSFETLVAVAEDGLSVADASGGDRHVETELYQLYERKRQARARTRAAQGLPEAEPERIVASVPPPSDAAPAKPSGPVLSPDDPIGQALLELLAAQGLDPSHLLELDPRAAADAIRRAKAQRREHPPAAAPAVSQSDRDAQLENLERRIAKLTQLLGMTEDELRRVSALKGVDFGLPSIFKTVQGLQGSEAQFERKKEMMRTILEANLELKRELEKSGP